MKVHVLYMYIYMYIQYTCTVGNFIFNTNVHQGLYLLFTVYVPIRILLTQLSFFGGSVGSSVIHCPALDV